jgi:hypothetical protein
MCSAAATRWRRNRIAVLVDHIALFLALRLVLDSAFDPERELGVPVMGLLPIAQTPVPELVELEICTIRVPARALERAGAHGLCDRRRKRNLPSPERESDAGALFTRRAPPGY